MGIFGAADGVTGAVFRVTVRFTGELDAGTLTVKKIFNGNKYITTKYKYKYKYKYQVPHLWYCDPSCLLSALFDRLLVGWFVRSLTPGHRLH